MKKTIKVLAAAISKKNFITKMIQYTFILVVVNLLFTFCLAGLFFLLTDKKILQAIVVGVFAAVFLLLNITAFMMKEFYARYKHPEKFFIEIDGGNFIHANGKVKRIIPLSTITGFREQEIWSRSGVHYVYIVDYRQSKRMNKPPQATSYTFYKSLSKTEFIYNIPAETFNQFI